MTIYEAAEIAEIVMAIKHERELNEVYHKKLAEWLEELKAYREIGTVEECKNSILDVQKAYNKAIDDIKEKLIEYGFIFTEHAERVFDEIAEQLKEGAGNGTDNQ